jgi:hypothetical protein
MDRFVGRAGLLIVASMLASHSAYALPIPSPVVIDFETEDDFTTPLVNGQSIYSTARPNNATPAIPFASDTVLEFGNLINVSSTIIGSDGHLGPAIFDSDPADNAGTLDPDLLVGLGNVLLLHRDEGPNHDIDPTYGLVFRNPNDEADFADRGSIVFDFLVPLCRPMTLDLVDVDDNVNVIVVLTDNLGRDRTYLVPENWTTQITDSPAGYHTLDLEDLAPQSAAPGATGLAATGVQDLGYDGSHVVRMEVQFLGSSPSGALDNLVFSRVPEPATAWLAVAAGAWVVTGRRRGRAPLP